MDYSLPGSSVHGIFQARVLEWGAIAFSDITVLPVIKKKKKKKHDMWKRRPLLTIEVLLAAKRQASTRQARYGIYLPFGGK